MQEYEILDKLFYSPDANGYRLCKHDDNFCLGENNTVSERFTEQDTYYNYNYEYTSWVPISWGTFYEKIKQIVELKKEREKLKCLNLIHFDWSFLD
jgi:hypothetical protein